MSRVARTILPATSIALAVACGGAEDAGLSRPTPAAGGSGGSDAGGSGGAVGGSGGEAAGGGAGSGAGGTSGSGGLAGTGETGGGTGGTGGLSGGAGTGGSGATGGAGGSAGSDGAVKLIAIGDTGEGNDGQRAVALQMDAKCQAVGGCTAVVMTGDNFYDHGVTSTSDTQWGPKFEDIYNLPNLNGLKFYATLGNHDYGLTSSGSKDAQIQYTQLPVGSGPGSRPSDKWVMYDAWYDVRLGPVHLFSMDTQDTSSTQKNDMRGRIQGSDATWKIVFGHHPRYTSGDHNKDNFLVDIAVGGMFATQQLLYCGADMFLTGHDHNVEFIDKGQDTTCPDTYFVISGAGAKVRSSSQPKIARQLYYNHSIPALTYLEFSGRSLLFEFIDQNGQLLFRKTIDK